MTGRTMGEGRCWSTNTGFSAVWTCVPGQCQVAEHSCNADGVRRWVAARDKRLLAGLEEVPVDRESRRQYDEGQVPAQLSIVNFELEGVGVCEHLLQQAAPLPEL